MNTVAQGEEVSFENLEVGRNHTATTDHALFHIQPFQHDGGGIRLRDDDGILRFRAASTWLHFDSAIGIAKYGGSGDKAMLDSRHGCG